MKFNVDLISKLSKGEITLKNNIKDRIIITNIINEAFPNSDRIAYGDSKYYAIDPYNSKSWVSGLEAENINLPAISANKFIAEDNLPESTSFEKALLTDPLLKLLQDHRILIIKYANARHLLNNIKGIGIPQITEEDKKKFKLIDQEIEARIQTLKINFKQRL